MSKPIESYALIGNCYTAALVGLDELPATTSGGPPLIGFLGDHIEVRHALVCVAVLLALAIAIAPPSARRTCRVRTRSPAAPPIAPADQAPRR